MNCNISLETILKKLVTNNEMVRLESIFAEIGVVNKQQGETLFKKAIQNMVKHGKGKAQAWAKTIMGNDFMVLYTESMSKFWVNLEINRTATARLHKFYATETEQLDSGSNHHDIQQQESELPHIGIPAVNDVQTLPSTSDSLLPTAVPSVKKSPVPLGSVEEYTLNFQKMKNERKWLLKSGRYVEDILYNIGVTKPKESICHSFTIDVSDTDIKAAFDDEEWNEVKSTNVKEDIALTQDIKELLKDLNKQSTSEIRAVIGEKLAAYLKMRYEEVFDQIQICYAALSLTMLYDMSPCPLLTTQLEMWYECNVWVPLLDKMYGDIENVQCVRSGESANLGSKRRKSTDGSTDKGVKNDLVIRTVGSGHRLEFAAGETSCNYRDGVDTKHLYEYTLKLPKSLRDMLMDLCDSVDWNPAIVNKLEVIGYLHHGLVAQHLILDNPRGYICRLLPLKKFHVPTGPSNFGLALELFAMNLKLKKRAKRTIAHLKERPLDLDFCATDEPVSPTLPPTFTTPPRPQGKYKKRSIEELYFRD